jgi:hypothetical protein
MAKSSTKRKYRVKAALEQVEQIEKRIDQAVQYIGDWQRRELISIALNKQPKSLPICIPIKKDTFVVGQYGLKRTGKLWEVTSSTSEKILYFSRRLTGLVYLLCLQTNHFKLAKEILQYDNKILLLTEEVEIFRHSIERARRKKDWWRYDLFINLVTHVEFQLEDTKNQLEKSIVLAKYFKIWDN